MNAHASQHRLATLRRRRRRRDDPLVRQGNLTFAPIPLGTRLDQSLIRRNEPLLAGDGERHIADELIRDRGQAIYVCPRFPHGLTPREYQRLVIQRPRDRRLGWTIQQRRPRTFVRGQVRHPNHKTVTLVAWRLVQGNVENDGRDEMSPNLSAGAATTAGQWRPRGSI